MEINSIYIAIIGWTYFLISILLNPKQRWIFGLPKELPIIDQFVNYILGI